MDHSKQQRIPRGIRNNNPLNIRVGNNWKGEVSHPTDHTFEQFTEMKWGCRAAFVILKNYILRHKLNTIVKIVNRWAPSNENNTQAYIASVVKYSLIKANEPIRFDNKCQMVNLFRGMCIVENGKEVSIEAILEGYDLACKK